MTKLTAANWQSVVRERDGPVLVNFYNPGCGHCVDFKADYEKLARHFKDIITVKKIWSRERCLKKKKYIEL